MEIITNFQNNDLYIFFNFTEVIIKPNKSIYRYILEIHVR